MVCWSSSRYTGVLSLPSYFTSTWVLATNDNFTINFDILYEKLTIHIFGAIFLCFLVIYNPDYPILYIFRQGFAGYGLASSQKCMELYISLVHFLHLLNLINFISK